MVLTLKLICFVISLTPKTLIAHGAKKNCKKSKPSFFDTIIGVFGQKMDGNKERRPILQEGFFRT